MSRYALFASKLHLVYVGSVMILLLCNAPGQSVAGILDACKNTTLSPTLGLMGYSWFSLQFT